MTASVAGAVMEDSPNESRTIEMMIGPKKAACGVDVSPAMIKPPAISNKPSATTIRVPTFRATTAPMGVKMAATTAKGSVCTPAESVEYPLTNWKYCVTKKMKPKRQKKATAMATAPPEKRGTAKTRTSSNGLAVRNSTMVNRARSTAAAAKQARVDVAPQPHCGPSMMARTNNDTPA